MKARMHAQRTQNTWEAGNALNKMQCAVESRGKIPLLQRPPTCAFTIRDRQAVDWEGVDETTPAAQRTPGEAGKCSSDETEEEGTLRSLLLWCKRRLILKSVIKESQRKLPLAVWMFCPNNPNTISLSSSVATD